MEVARPKARPINNPRTAMCIPIGSSYPPSAAADERNGGEGGIRTHEGREPLTVFKTVAVNRLATSPRLEIRRQERISGRATPATPLFIQQIERQLQLHRASARRRGGELGSPRGEYWDRPPRFSARTLKAMSLYSPFLRGTGTEGATTSARVLRSISNGTAVMTSSAPSDHVLPVLETSDTLCVMWDCYERRRLLLRGAR